MSYDPEEYAKDYPEDYYVAVPVEVLDELIQGEDATARSAPGVRVDAGAAFDAVRIAIELGGGLTTVIVGVPQLRAFASRLVFALNRRGVERVTVDSGEARIGSKSASSVVEASDEELYRELLRRVAATSTPATPVEPSAHAAPTED